MTDFLPGSDPAKNAPADSSTSFQQGGAPNPAANPDDNAVVFEHGGRKFTKADLAKKLDNADAHIQRLTQERASDRKLLDEVNATLAKQVNAAELLKQIKEGNVQAPANPNPPASEAAPAVTADAVAAQVMAKLKEGQDAQQRDANFQEVTAALTNAFGDATNAKVAAMAAEAGMTIPEAVEMAKSKPKVFLKMFPELVTKAQPTATSRGTVNTQSFQTAPKGPSGYTKVSGDTRKSIEIYQARLKELGL